MRRPKTPAGPMAFPLPTDAAPCIRCQKPVPITKTLEARDGVVVLAFVTVSVVCDECWTTEPVSA